MRRNPPEYFPGIASYYMQIAAGGMASNGQKWAMEGE
jgi:hypothetical protein